MKGYWYFYVYMLIIGMSCLCFCVGCGNGYELDENGRPNMLRIAYVPPEENVDAARTRLNAFTDYLSAKLGMPVSMVKMSGGYAPTIEALKADKVDIGSLGSFGFVIAERRANVEPLIMRGHKETGDGIYHSLFLTTRPDIQSMEDVKSMASELKIALGNPASTSGHLIPRKYLEDFGLDPQKDFKELVHCPEHTASLMSVLTRNVDVAGMSESVLNAYIYKGLLTLDDVTVLWKSAPIPTGPIVIRKALPEDFKKEVQQAYLDLREEEPEIWEGVRGTRSPDIIYWAADTKKWDPIRELAEKLRKELYE